MAIPFSLTRPKDAALAMRGLRVLMSGPEKGGVPAADVEEKIEGFLAYARSIQLDIHRQVLALEPDGRIGGMCLWVPSPGRSVMLFAPSLSDYPEAASATEQAIVGALEDARAVGIVLVQAMLEPNDAAGKTVFAAAGLSRLATLTYMERRPPSHVPEFSLPAGLTLAAYEAATHGHFCEAITGSYEGTLDCPALSGMRAVDEVLEGHKGVGVFDPQLWAVVLRSGRAVGCLLLSEIPARRGLELVYLGLTPEARGQGLGRTLMQRALAIGCRRNFEVMTLAVDAANVPAVRLYRRCGYSSVAQRVAMVKRIG